MNFNKLSYHNRQAQLPKGWEIKQLGEVCVKTSNVKWGASNGEEHHYIDLSSVSRDDFDIMETVLVNYENAPSRAKKNIKTGDIIFATTRPTLKRLTIIPEYYDNQICSTGFTVLRPNSDQIISGYIFYSLLQDSFMMRMESLQRGASYPAVTDSDVKGFEIPIPPLPEQQRLVSLLDRAFAAIDQAKANAEKNLQNAKALFESYLGSIDSEKVDLGDLVEITTGKLNSNAAKDNGQYPFFTCSREVYKIDNYSFDQEAVLLAGNNASGDFNVKHYKGKFNAYQRTYVISSNKDHRILNKYLYYQLHKSLKEFKDMSIGANTRFLKIGMIKGLRIALPSTEIQREIIQKLDILLTETQKLETLYQKKIDALEELKKSVLQKAFSGSLNLDFKDSQITTISKKSSHHVNQVYGQGS